MKSCFRELRDKAIEALTNYKQYNGADTRLALAYATLAQAAAMKEIADAIKLHASMQSRPSM
ncbi:MAG: hypothetical protein Q7R91_00115 [bacterium]|nr:hypothetical protein [bacterium]